MPNETMEPVIIRHVTGALKRKIYSRANAQNTSIRAVVQQVICDHYGMDYVRVAGKTSRERVTFTKTPITAHLPSSVKTNVDLQARDERRPAGDVMREILCNEFGEPFTPAGRWPSAA